MEQGVEICRDAAASGGIFRRAAMDSSRAFLLAIGILLALWQKGDGDELRFATAAQWRQWELPLGAVELTREGIIQPVAVRRNNNAVLDAVAFGGGISRVGSNPLEAPGVLDGDENTGWGPDLDEMAEDWFVEVDLGRVVSAHRVHLIFSARGPPFEIFDLLLSTGEQFRDETRTQIEGTLAYRIKERFTEDRHRRITYELNPDEPFPVHFVRVEVLKAAPEARLVEIEVEGKSTRIGAHQALKYRALRAGELDASELPHACLVAYSIPQHVKEFCGRHGVSALEIQPEQ